MVKGKFDSLMAVSITCLLLLVAVSSEGQTTFNYTGNRLSNGGLITASVTLSCSQPCFPGKYQGDSMLALSLSYGSVTLSWPPGNGAPVDPWITLDSNGQVVDWHLLIVNAFPMDPYANFLLQTLNTTDPRYQLLDTADGIIKGGVHDSVTFRQAPLFELHVLESNGDAPGTWTATAVPEPSTLSFVLVAGITAIGASLARRFRR